MFMKIYTRLSAGWLAGLLLLILAAPLQAQVYTRRLPAAAMSQYGAFGPDATLPKSTLQSVDTSPLVADDVQRAKQGLPARLGVDVPTGIDLLRAAARSVKNGYQVSTYQLDVPNALGVAIVFDALQLAAGARLFIYNADRTLLIGPITAQQNGRNFWSDLVEGPSAIVEVQEPVQSIGQSRVHVAKLIQYYRFAPRFGFGTSGSCELNTSCYPAYQNEADGVNLLLTNYSPYTYACTGAMVNSTQQDFRSYLLTAFHCYDFTEDGVQSPSELAAAANTQVRFHWESPTCATAPDNVYLTLTGANFRSAYANSDFTLLELTQQVPPSENTTYLGWDRSGNLPGSPFGIHHPSADVKKISFSPNATTLVNVTPGPDYIINAGTTHLQVTWAGSPTILGVTEGGSSGSPLFDNNRRIVGQLHGGGSYCNNPTSPDQYGRLFTSWTGGGTTSTRLSDWLDPTSTGAITANSIKSTIVGPATLTTTGSYSLNSGSSAVTSWTVTSGAGIVSPTTGTGNIAALTALTAGSNLSITFGVSAGQSYPIQFTRTFNVAAPPIPTSPATLTITSFTCNTTNSALSSVNFVVGYSDQTFAPALPDLFINGVTITGQLGQTYTYPFDANTGPLPIQDQATRSTYFVWDYKAACATGSTPPPPPNPPASPAALTITSFTCFSTAGALSSVNFVVGYGNGTFTPALPDLFINGVTITGQLGQTYTFPFDQNVNNLTIADNASRSTYFVWNFRQACATVANPTNPPNPPIPTGPATLTVTNFVCNYTNAVLSSVEFVVGYSDETFTPALPLLFINGVTDKGVLGQSYSFPFDQNVSTLTIADQATYAPYFTWNFRQACIAHGSQARIAAEPAVSLQVIPLGNPVGDVVEVEVSGAGGGPLNLLLTDTQGRTLGQQHIERAGSAQRVRFPLNAQPAGVLLLRATTPTQTRVIRLLKAK